MVHLNFPHAKVDIHNQPAEGGRSVSMTCRRSHGRMAGYTRATLDAKESYRHRGAVGETVELSLEQNTMIRRASTWAIHQAREVVNYETIGRVFFGLAPGTAMFAF
jgi:hypothetical protein